MLLPAKGKIFNRIKAMFENQIGLGIQFFKISLNSS